MNNDIYNNYINKLDMDIVMQKFLEIYKPSNNLVKPEQKFIDEAKKIVPKEIIDLWTKYGFGEYGNGIIKIVNPEEYMGILYEWLGKEDFTKIPLIVDAFGDIFYYRYLGNGVNDISVIDIHYGEIQVCAYSYQEFFGKYIINFKANDIYLRIQLYSEAINKCGKLAINEAYFFQPAIKTAGYEHINFVKKGDCKASQEFLFQLKLNEINLINKHNVNSSLMIINKVFQTENGLTPILGNVIKGMLTIGDKITIYRGDDQSFDGVIEKINVGKENINTIDVRDKVVIYLKNISDNQIKNINILNRSILVKK